MTAGYIADATVSHPHTSTVQLTDLSGANLLADNAVVSGCERIITIVGY